MVERSLCIDFGERPAGEGSIGDPPDSIVMRVSRPESVRVLQPMRHREADVEIRPVPPGTVRWIEPGRGLVPWAGVSALTHRDEVSPVPGSNASQFNET